MNALLMTLFGHGITAGVAAAITFFVSHKTQIFTLVADIKAILADANAVATAKTMVARESKPSV